MNPKLPISLFLLYTALILTATFIPTGSSSALSSTHVINFRLDYLLHILIFLPWALFGYLLGRSIWLWLIIGIFFATFTEAVHYLLPYRSYNINDLLANNAGILLGYLYKLFPFPKKPGK